MHRVWISLGAAGTAVAVIPAATDYGADEVANWFLYAAFAATLSLAALYVLLMPWWKTVFGISFALILWGLVLLYGRTLLDSWVGEDYPGQDWLLLAGRVELTFASIAAVAMFVTYLVRGHWFPSEDTEQISGPDGTFVDH